MIHHYYCRFIKSRVVSYLLLFGMLFLSSFIFAASSNGEKAKLVKSIQEVKMSNLFIDNSVMGLTLNEQSSPEIFHLFTHGRPGELLINGQWKDAKQIAAFLKPIIQQSPVEIRHLNIYGCEFAKSEIGKEAVSVLEETLGVSVAASDDLTGLDGDWELEVGKPIDTLMPENYPYNLQYDPNDDFDGDGIINSVDLDDDNDGILDTVENSC